MNKAHNKKEIISTILKFNLVIGVYNLYLYAVGQSLFNLVIGSMNIGVWTFFRDYSLLSLIVKYNKIKK